MGKLQLAWDWSFSSVVCQSELLKFALSPCHSMAGIQTVCDMIVEQIYSNDVPFMTLVICPNKGWWVGRSAPWLGMMIVPEWTKMAGLSAPGWV